MIVYWHGCELTGSSGTNQPALRVRTDSLWIRSTGGSGANRPAVRVRIDRRFGYEPTGHETTVSTKRLETNTLALMNIFSLYQ